MKGTYRDLVKSYTSATGAELVIESMIAVKMVTFPAFLTNLNQDFKSSWNTEQVYGTLVEGSHEFENLGFVVYALESRRFEERSVMCVLRVVC